MTSVAADGAADRIALRIFLSVLRAGSGTHARYPSTFLGGALAPELEPLPRVVAFFRATMMDYLAAVVSGTS